MQKNSCSTCGAELIPDISGRLCPACMLAAGLADEVSDNEQGRDQNLVRFPDPGHPRLPPAKSIRDFGEYELLAEIARGGQGVVFRARHKGLQRLVALKMIALGPWATETNLRRFRTEAEAAAALDHPQIVPIYEIGRVDDQPFFTMKLIDGPSLKQLLVNGPFPTWRAAEIVAATARAIHHAHQRGILHQDLKPGNILLDAHGQPYVTDFGLAKLIDEESAATRTRDLLGTPSYMSPEQASRDARQLTLATDIYGLGAVLYELLTACPPFAGGTAYETVRQVLEKEPRRPRLWNPKVDRDLETICLKCLEKIPGKRFPSAAALGEELDRWLRYEPIQSRPIGPLPKAIKWVQRNRAMAMTLVTLILFGTALGIIFWQNIFHQNRQAETLKSIAIVLRPSDIRTAALAKEWSRELINTFSSLSGLKTLERSQSLKWEDSNASLATIGQGLKTSAVLLGELRVEEHRLLLAVEMMGFPGQTQLWSHVFTPSTGDWDSVRSQIGREVLSRLGLSPTAVDQARLRRPLSQTADALNAYYKGLDSGDVMDGLSLQRAITNFEAAIRLDPKFAQAHAGIGQACISLSVLDYAPAPLMAKARASIHTALDIDPMLPEARAADGIVKFFYDWDWSGAEKALDEALRMDVSAVEGNACYLHLLDVYGQGKEALNTVKTAAGLHAGSKAIRSELGCAAYYAGLFDEAETFGQDALEKDPENAANYFLLARTLVQRSRYEDAMKILRLGKTKPGGNWSALDAELAYIHARQGETNQAQRAIAELRKRELTEYIDPYIYAMIYAGLRDTNRVFEFLNQACDKKSGWIPSLPAEPKFAEYRNDSRYQQILRRLKIPSPSNAGSEPRPLNHDF